MQIYIFYDISRSIKNWSCCTGYKDFNGSELSDMFGNPAEGFGLGKLNPGPGPLEPSAMPTEPRTQKPAQQIVLPSTTNTPYVLVGYRTSVGFAYGRARRRMEVV